jgi:hypothetical protein
MKTIKKVFNEFLKEQKAHLSQRTLRGYEDAIFLFQSYLNEYASQYLDERETEIFENKGKEFCEVFSPDQIGSTEINEFLNYFIIRKVMGSKELMKNVSRAMKKLVKWMNEKGYMAGEEYELGTEIADRAKADLPQCEELANLILEACEYGEYEEYSEKVDGYWQVTKIQSGKLWLEDYSGSRKKIGPVPVDHEISSLCKVGWVINLVLGRTRRGWIMLESGNVYPH